MTSGFGPVRQRPLICVSVCVCFASAKPTQTATTDSWWRRNVADAATAADNWPTKCKSSLVSSSSFCGEPRARQAPPTVWPAKILSCAKTSAGPLGLAQLSLLCQSNGFDPLGQRRLESPPEIQLDEAEIEYEEGEEARLNPSLGATPGHSGEQQKQHPAQ